VIGDSYRSKVETLNQSFEFDQDVDPVSLNLTRNVKPYNINDYEFITNSQKNTTTQARITSVSRGQVSRVDIIDSGSEYRVGDNLVFDNTNTGGFGAVGTVHEVFGPQITSLNHSVTKFTGTTLLYAGGKVTGITTVPHGLLTGAVLTIKNVSSNNHKVFEGEHKITEVKRVSSGITTALNTVDANNGLTTSFGITDDVRLFNVNDIIKIDHEEFKIFGIDTLQNQLDVLRAQNNTNGLAHTFGARITREDREFTFELDGADQQKRYTIYFDAGMMLLE